MAIRFHDPESYVGETLFDEYPELKHFVVTSTINIAARNPYVFAATMVGHGLYHLLHDSKGSGAPPGTTPTSTISSKRRQGRASAERGKHGGPRQSSQRGGRVRRKGCPKGHYWSYKEKKCVRSKF